MTKKTIPGTVAIREKVELLPIVELPKSKSKRRPKAQRPPKRGGRTSDQNLIPSWALSASEPFTFDPTHIPDSCTTSSGLCPSYQDYRGSVYNNDGGDTTTHNFGFVIPPYPYYTTFSGNSAGLLSDLAGNGVGFNSPWNTLTATSTPSSIPNISAVLGTTNVNEKRSRIRCTGIAVRVTYEGTELNRSGKLIAALVPVTGEGSTIATTGTSLSLLGAVLGTGLNDVLQDPSRIKQQASSYSEQRIGNDPMVYRWFPGGTPTYQLAAAAPENYSVTAATTNAPLTSVWRQPDGGVGTQGGQNVLVVAIIGDQTAISQAGSNPYSVSIKWMWEVIPDDPYTVGYSLSCSPANGIVLDECLNIFQNLSVAERPGNGSARA